MDFETPIVSWPEPMLKITKHPERLLPSGHIMIKQFADIVPVSSRTIEMKEVARHALQTPPNVDKFRQHYQNY